MVMIRPGKAHYTKLCVEYYTIDQTDKYTRSNIDEYRAARRVSIMRIHNGNMKTYFRQIDNKTSTLTPVLTQCIDITKIKGCLRTA